MSTGLKVLVTGGAGYIGSHTAKALAKAGYEPVIYDNLSMGHRWAVKWGRLVEGDLADGDKLREAIEKHQVSAVVHFAANAYVGESMQNPRKYFQNNVVNSLNLLNVMLDTGVEHIVFSSSCATYGVPEAVPITESHPQRPINPYGDSKLFVERALHWYREAYGLKYVALRYFNAAGADPEGEIGEDHDPETHLIPLAIQAALGRRSHVDIYGTDYPTPDGTASRDYIHVSDLAAAHVQALGFLLDVGESTALNLGTGLGYTVRDVIRAVEQVSGRPVPVREAPRRAGDPPELVADPGRAQKVLAWQAKYTALAEIVQTAWQWHMAKNDTEDNAIKGQ